MLRVYFLLSSHLHCMRAAKYRRICYWWICSDASQNKVTKAKRPLSCEHIQFKKDGIRVSSQIKRKLFVGWTGCTQKKTTMKHTSQMYVVLSSVSIKILLISRININSVDVTRPTFKLNSLHFRTMVSTYFYCFSATVNSYSPHVRLLNNFSRLCGLSVCLSVSVSVFVFRLKLL